MNEFVTVFSAELMRRLKSRSFRIGLLIGAAGIVVMLRLPSYMNSFANSSYKVVLAGDAAVVAQARPLLAKDFNIAAQRPGLIHPAQRDIDAAGRASAVIVLTRSNGLRAVVYARDPGSVSESKLRRDLLRLHLKLATNWTQAKVASLASMPLTVLPLASKFGTAAQADQARGIAYILIFLLYLLIVLNSQLIMTSVAEEKTSRIAELLVASVDPGALLAGKIAASAVLAIVQMIAWILVGFLAGASAGLAPGSQSEPGSGPAIGMGSVPPGDIAGFAVFFLLGYLQMAVMFAAIGSLINRTEDIGSIGGPFFIPVIAALIIATTALAVPDAPIVIITSFVPLIAPFVMFARIVVSTVPTWQIALSFAINLAAIYGFAVLGGKIYRIGMLLYGRPPKLSQLIRSLRS